MRCHQCWQGFGGRSPAPSSPPTSRSSCRTRQAVTHTRSHPKQLAVASLPPKTSLPFLHPRLLLPVPVRLCLALSSPRDGHRAPSSHTKPPKCSWQAILTPPIGVPDHLLGLSRSLQALPLLPQGEGPAALHPCPQAHTHVHSRAPAHPKRYFHSTMLMHAFRSGFCRVKQNRARGGRGAAGGTGFLDFSFCCLFFTSSWGEAGSMVFVPKPFLTPLPGSRPVGAPREPPSCGARLLRAPGRVVGQWGLEAALACPNTQNTDLNLDPSLAPGCCHSS